MNEVTLANFRCFREEQTVRLAPLTLLVGENSTGKTSFLALIRALWDVAFRERLPDFKEPPYDLGSFDEIAHFRGGRGGRAEDFTAGFSVGKFGGTDPRRSKAALPRFHFTFRRDGSGALPTVRRIESPTATAECRISDDGSVSLAVSTSNGDWIVPPSPFGMVERFAATGGWESRRRDLPPMEYMIWTFLQVVRAAPEGLENGAEAVDPPSDQDVEEIRRLAVPGSRGFHAFRSSARPFSGAPVRSRPRRTYDPTQAVPDPEGEYIPMFLASVARGHSATWNNLKQSLEQFGQEAGLFDEIKIRVLGGKTGGPFQVRIRKLGKRSKGPHRNMIDVGYGVSQVLPVVTELLRPRGAQMFLLQQPEVHLHPSAQAALGGLFAREAKKDHRQLVVETHSDHLIDRVRMDIRDGRTHLKPNDVSILYFERRNLAVAVHSLGWDANGNLLAKRGEIPDGYRQFFRSERRRSLGL